MQSCTCYAENIFIFFGITNKQYYFNSFHLFGFYALIHHISSHSLVLLMSSSWFWGRHSLSLSNCTVLCCGAQSILSGQNWSNKCKLSPPASQPFEQLLCALGHGGIQVGFNGIRAGIISETLAGYRQETEVKCWWDTGGKRRRIGEI